MVGNPGFEGKFTREVTRVATNLSDTTALATAAQAVRDKALEARDSASAVNLDEEAAELIRFQQAYQASAKIIAAAREIFQRSAEHTSELQSLMRISYAVFCLKKQKEQP